MTFLRPPFLFVVAAAGAILAHAGTGPDRAGAPSWLEQLSVNAFATASWVENISRTSNPASRKDAATYEFSVGATRHQQLSPNWLMHLGAGADLLSVPEYDQTGNFRIGPQFGLQRKFGLGPLAPVLQFDASYTYKAARIDSDRGWTAEGGVRLAKRLTDSLRVAASAQWLEHYANSATFDIQQRTVAVEVNWDISERWRLGGSASWLAGRVVANASWPVWQQAIGGGLGSTVSNYYNSIPWEVTDSYGPRWVSYNVDARANLWWVALDYALTGQTTLELRASGAYVINEIDIRYPTESWGLSLIHRF